MLLLLEAKPDTLKPHRSFLHSLLFPQKSVHPAYAAKTPSPAMRYPWRLILRRAYHRSSFHISTNFSQFQVQSNPNLQSLASLTSLLHSHCIHCTVSSPCVESRFTDSVNPRNHFIRNISSEPALKPKVSDHVILAEIFGKQMGTDDIKKELELNNVLISHEMVLNVLGKFNSSPEVAKRFFDWVLETDSDRLSSKSYNLMLGILGVNGFVKDFWDLVDVMKKKGYGVSKGVRYEVLKKFEKEGMGSDIVKLKTLFASGSMDNLTEKIYSRVCKIIRNEVWGDDVEKQLQDLKIAFSRSMVKMVLESLGMEPAKALIFFRWLEETGLFKHDRSTYNSMARVLGREDSIDRFWKVVDEMRSVGYEMEVETCVKVLGRFVKRRMMDEAVDLYEFAMAGANKPSEQCCTFLLRKIVVINKLDMSLFSRVVKVFTENGNMFTNSTLDAVLKSLTSVGRFGECNKILKAMKESGFVATGHLQSKIAFGLSAAGNKEEASESNTDHNTWASLVEGHCLAGDLEKAYDSFLKILEIEGASSSGYPFQLLVNAYCHKIRAIDAGNILSVLVKEKQLKPWHSTYKLLISKLMVQGGFKDALNLLGLMKNHGFPPFIYPFIEYVSKSGTGDDAILFLKEMTSKRFPSTSVFLRMFEAFFKSGRHTEAQNFLSKCPPHIRNHADVLNLFCSMKSRKVASSVMLSA
ncbi:Pentatricopeptide repeat-containing protein [Quillaja saponaria]|uniref:Pentatricopeptide repeat-containing protein n=1 Tax=Quillaja saponaria TaxID=32244 RepID=A0AAD7VFY3_QUISA|nr:Pentatricopeptide repeat-containing protein [Quillaja saponaria]